MLDIYSPEDTVKRIKIAEDEMLYLSSLHATWSLGARNVTLSRFLGSYEGKAYAVIRVALARELMVGLNRFWDSKDHNIHPEKLSRSLKDSQTFLTTICLANRRDCFPSDLLDQYATRRDAVCALIHESKLFEKDHWKPLVALRGNFLAHRQVEAIWHKTQDSSEIDTLIEHRFQKTFAVVTGLTDCIGRASTLDVSAKIDRFYSFKFWRSIKTKRATTS